MSRPTLSPYDRSSRTGYRVRNALQTALLLGGMVILLAACGWAVAGLPGLVWAGLLGGLGLTLSARVSPHLAVRFLGGEPLPAGELPEIREIVAELTRRSELIRPPRLYHIATPVMTAFSIGNREDAGIVMSSGLIRGLTLRELAGVLAHEISHLRHNDPWIMALANVVRSLTGTMSFFGIALLFLNLPLMMTGATPVPWMLVLLLTFAPTLGALLQLALSRSREFDADLDAAGLSGDPIGLAAALEKLEHQEGRFWESMMAPGGKRARIPTLLMSHPRTDERVARLHALGEHEPEWPPATPAGDEGDARRARSIIPDTPRRRRWPWRHWGRWA